MMENFIITIGRQPAAADGKSAGVWLNGLGFPTMGGKN